MMEKKHVSRQSKGCLFFRFKAFFFFEQKFAQEPQGFLLFAFNRCGRLLGEADG